jgi:hypothetical protein
MTVAVQLPEFVANDLVKLDLATRTLDRSAAEVVPVALTVIGLTADTVGLYLARHQIRAAWSRAIATMRRDRRAQVLEVSVGSFLSLKIDLDELPEGVTRRDHIAPTMEALIDLLGVVSGED